MPRHDGTPTIAEMLGGGSRLSDARERAAQVRLLDPRRLCHTVCSDCGYPILVDASIPGAPTVPCRVCELRARVDHLDTKICDIQTQIVLARLDVIAGRTGLEIPKDGPMAMLVALDFVLKLLNEV